MQTGVVMLFGDAGSIPSWGQYGAVGVLLIAAVAWWRYSTTQIDKARGETHDIWERMASTVIPALEKLGISADHNATATERVVSVMEDAVSVIRAERSAKETFHRELLEESLRVATLRAELAEERARG